MGSNLAGALVQLQILIALVLALVFLGERLTLLKGLGIVLTFTGSAITLYDRGPPRTSADAAAPKFVPNMVEGCTFGLMSAVFYAVGPTLVRAGLEGTNDSIAAGCVSYLAAALALAAFLAISPRQRRHAIDIDRTAAPWFAISGVAVNVSQFFVYLALAIAPVTVVVPIGQLYIVFRLIFAWFLNREYEVFDFRILVAIVLALGGAVLLAVDPVMVGDTLGLSPDIRRLLDLAWP